jgi:hypothetical protein
MTKPIEPPPGALALAPCIGCGAQTLSHNIACRQCYLIIPGMLKREFSNTKPHTTERKKVVGRMRAWLRDVAPTIETP